MTYSITFSPNPLDPTDTHTIHTSLLPHTSLSHAFQQTKHLIPPHLPLIAFLNHQPILRKHWHSTTLHKNDHITFSSLPQREVVASALTLFAIAASGPIGAGLGASLFGAGTFGASLTSGLFSTAFVGLIGSTAWATVAPSKNLGLSPSSPSYALSPHANSVRTGKAIPVIYGHHRIVPDLISPPYSRFENKGRQTLYQLFAVGHGEFNLTKGTIGSSLLNSQDHGFSPSKSIIPPHKKLPVVNGLWHAMNGNISRYFLEYEKDFSEPVSVGKPSFPIKTIEVDISLPQGLHSNRPEDRKNGYIKFHIQYRKIGTTSWKNIPKTFSLSGGSEDTQYPPQINYAQPYITFQAASAQPIHYSFSWNVYPYGTYEVRIKRATPSSSSLVARAFWVGLKGFLYQPPRSYPISTLPLKLKANASTSGTAARHIALHVTRKIPSYSPKSGWSKPAPSKSVAFAIADMLTNTSYGAGLNENQIDLQTLYNLHNSLPSHHTFNAIFDQSTTLWEALRRAARCARTSLYIQGGKVRFSRDSDFSPPVALFSAHNIIKDSFSLHHKLDSQDTPDKVIIEYIHPENWISDTVSAQAPHSFKPLNTLKLPLFGCTHPQHAQDEANFILKSSQNQRRIVKFDTELDGLLPLFGDTIAISHPLTSWGTSGFVTAFEPRNKTLSISQNISKNGFMVIQAKDGSIIGPFAVKPTQEQPPHNLVTITEKNFNNQLLHLNLPASFAFGDSDSSWAANAKIIAIRPKNRHIVSIEALVENLND